MGFPLLSLPSVALENIVYQLDLVDVIELTYKFSRFKEHVQIFKRKVDYIEFNFPRSIVVMSEPKVVFKCSESETNDLSKKIEEISRGEESTVFKMKNVGHQCSFHFWEDLTIQLLSVLRPKHFDCNYSHSVKYIEDFFLWKYCRKFRHLKIYDHIQLTNQEVTFLLENIYSKFFEYKARFDRNFKYEKPLRSFRVVLETPYGIPWLTQKSLINSDCKIIEIHGKFPNYCINFNQFLISWMSKRDDSLALFIYRTRSFEANISTFLNGTNATPTVFKIWELKSRTIYIDDNPAYDIRRPSDGRVATVTFTDSDFYFYAWHDEMLKFCSPETRKKLKRLNK